MNLSAIQMRGYASLVQGDKSQTDGASNKEDKKYCLGMSPDRAAKREEFVKSMQCRVVNNVSTETQGECNREGWLQMDENSRTEFVIKQFITGKPLRRVFTEGGDSYTTYFYKSGVKCQAYVPNDMTFLTEYYYNKYGIDIFYVEGEEELESYLEQLVSSSGSSGVKKVAFIFKTSTAEGADPRGYGLHYIPIIFESINGKCSLFILDSDYAFTSRGMNCPFLNQRHCFEGENVYFTGASLQSDTASCGSSSLALAKTALRYDGELKELMIPLDAHLLEQTDGASGSSELYPSTFQKVIPGGPFTKYTQKSKVIDVMKSQDYSVLFSKGLVVKSEAQSLESYLKAKHQPERMDAETYRVIDGVVDDLTESGKRDKYAQLHYTGIMNIERVKWVISREFESDKYDTVESMHRVLKARQTTRRQDILLPAFSERHNAPAYPER